MSTVTIEEEHWREGSTHHSIILDNINDEYVVSYSNDWEGTVEEDSFKALDEAKGYYKSLLEEHHYRYRDHE